MNTDIPFSATAGLVLAGGQSTRMGEDKAILKTGRQFLFERMTEIMSQTPVEQVLLSGNSMNNSRCLPHAICDSVNDRGPMGGIYSVLQATANITALLVIPVDMPLMVPALLTRLLMAGQSCNSPVMYKDKTLPLYLPVTPHVIDVIKNNISSQNHRDYSLWRLHQQFNGKTIPIPSGYSSCFHNANTPEEWACCKKALANGNCS